MDKLKVYISEITDPFLNLAVEDQIFRMAGENERILILWRNRESVVIGRYQNPFLECNLRLIRDNGILLVRRQSGGGAVYHDTGNLNFTFISERKKHNKENNITVILSALRSLNIEASTSDRSDITVGGMKISGSAFKLGSRFAFHHGTLLINTNLGKLGLYLRAENSGIESKGIKSVRSGVANLSDFNPLIDYKLLGENVINQFSKFYDCTCSTEVISGCKFDDPEFNSRYDEFRSWDWLFGKTPDFKQIISGHYKDRDIDIAIDTHRGKIRGIEICSAPPVPGIRKIIETALMGCRYSAKYIKEALNNPEDHTESGRKEILDFAYWISRRISG